MLTLAETCFNSQAMKFTNKKGFHDICEIGHVYETCFKSKVICNHVSKCETNYFMNEW